MTTFDGKGKGKGSVLYRYRSPGGEVNDTLCLLQERHVDDRRGAVKKNERPE
jgi:hypothetical protein